MKPTYEELQLQLAVVVAEAAGLKQALDYVINPDNQPEYHDQGMGCGVEDRGYQRDGYSACSYGWESAMERVYSEVIPDALPEPPATDAYLAEVRALGAEQAGEYLKQYAQGVHEDARLVLQDAGELCNGFAAKLRQGVEHE
ncbi:hypothetical protein [Kluyvera ascorbata]|uniref:hypothetical protein n=1 Tax=Kluyvera ascorbata TaxID=51288 RepID=UPI0039F6C346